MASFNQAIFGSPDCGQMNYRPAVTARDNSSTTLPTGPTVTADGVTIANYQRVLFTNLTTGNNNVYLATGIGDPVNGVQWHLQLDGPGSPGGPTAAAPAVLDTIYVQEGTTYSQLLLGWTGSAWITLTLTIP